MPEQNEQLQQFAAENNIVPAKNKLPEVIIPGFGSTLLEASERIFTAVKASKEIFFRGGVVVCLRRQSNGQIDFVPLDPVTARSLFEKSVKFVKPGKNGTPTCTILPKDQAEAILRSAKAEEILTHVDYLAQVPVLVQRDNQLVTVTQCDENSRIYVTGGDVKRPESLDMAVKIIESVIEDYIFAEDSDKSRAIAAILTPALSMGGLLEKVPAFLLEADDSQAGKTFFVLLICGIYRETPRIITQKKGGVGSLDESIGSALMSGNAFLLFDNLRDDINSMYFESLMTAQGQFPVRVPYLQEVTIDCRRRNVMLTSNGVKMTPDLAKRLCVIRIKKDPDLVPLCFEGKNILEAVHAFQPGFLGAVHMVIEEWHKRGKQRTDEGRHSFREWAQSMDWIVQNIFELPPLLDDHDRVGQRLSDPYLAFIEHLSRSVALAAACLEYQAKDLAASAQAHTIQIPGLGELAQNDADAGAKQIGVIMRKLFKDQSSLKTEHGTWHRAKKDIPSPSGGDPYSGWIYTFQKKDIENPRPPLPPNPMKQSG